MQAHEGEQVEQLTGCSAQPRLAAAPADSQLDSREGVHGHRVALDLGDVAESNIGAGPVEQRANLVAESGQVASGDPAVDCEHDGLRR